MTTLPFIHDDGAVEYADVRLSPFGQRKVTECCIDTICADPRRHLASHESWCRCGKLWRTSVLGAGWELVATRPQYERLTAEVADV